LNLKLGSDKIEHQGIDCVPVGLASCGTIYWHYFGSQLWPPGSLPRARGMETLAIQIFRNKPRL